MLLLLIVATGVLVSCGYGATLTLLEATTTYVPIDEYTPHTTIVQQKGSFDASIGKLAVSLGSEVNCQGKNFRHRSHLLVDDFIMCQVVITSETVEIFVVNQDKGMWLSPSTAFTLKDLDLDQKTGKILGASDIDEVIGKANRWRLALSVESEKKGERIVIYQLECSLSTKVWHTFGQLTKKPVSCKIKRSHSEDVDAMYLYSPSPLKAIRCSPKLQFIKFKEIAEISYVVRYCPLNHLPLHDRSSFRNYLEFYEDKESSIKFVLNISTVNLGPKDKRPLQLLTLAELEPAAVMFTVTHSIALTNNFPKSGLLGQVTASTSYETKCSKKDRSTLSCLHLDIDIIRRGDFVSTEHGIIGKSQVKIPNYASSSVLGAEAIIGITGSFALVVNKAYGTAIIISGGKAVGEAKFSHLQNRTIFDIGGLDENSGSWVPELDFGIITHIHDNRTIGLEAIAVREPFLRITAKNLPPKSACFGKLRYCEEGGIRLLFGEGINEKTYNVYHLSQNFKGVLPTFTDPKLMVPVYRNKIVLNISSMFIGSTEKAAMLVDQPDYMRDMDSHGNAKGSRHLLDPSFNIWADKLFMIKNIPLRPQDPKGTWQGDRLAKLTLSQYGLLMLVERYYPVQYNAVWFMDTPDSNVSFSSLQVTSARLPRDVDLDQFVAIGIRGGGQAAIFSINSEFIQAVVHFSGHGAIGPIDLGLGNMIRTAREEEGEGVVFIMGKDDVRIVELEHTGEQKKRFIVIELFNSKVDALLRDIPGLDPLLKLKIIDARLWNRQSLFILAEDEFGQRVFGLFGCSLPVADMFGNSEEIEVEPGRCKVIGSMDFGTTRDILVLVDPEQSVWVIDTNRGIIKTFEISVFKYFAETTLGSKISAKNTLDLGNLLNLHILEVVRPTEDPNLGYIRMCEDGVANIKVRAIYSNRTRVVLLISLNLRRVDAINRIRVLDDNMTQEIIGMGDSSKSPQFFCSMNYKDNSLKLLFPEPYLGANVTDLGEYDKLESNTVYITNKFMLNVESTYEVGFEQEVFGTSRHLFGLRFTDREDPVPKAGLDVKDVVHGFIQNFSLYCSPLDLVSTEYTIGRFGKINSMRCLYDYQEDSSSLFEYNVNTSNAYATIGHYIWKEYTVKDFGDSVFDVLSQQKYQPVYETEFNKYQHSKQLQKSRRLLSVEAPYLNGAPRNTTLLGASILREVDDSGIEITESFVSTRFDNFLIGLTNRYIVVISIGISLYNTIPKMFFEPIDQQTGLSVPLAGCKRLFENHFDKSEKSDNLLVTAVCMTEEKKAVFVVICLDLSLQDHKNPVHRAEATIFAELETSSILSQAIQQYEITIDYHDNLIYVLDGPSKSKRNPQPRQLTAYLIEKYSKNTFIASKLLSTLSVEEIAQANIQKFIVFPQVILILADNGPRWMAYFVKIDRRGTAPSFGDFSIIELEHDSKSRALEVFASRQMTLGSPVSVFLLDEDYMTEYVSQDLWRLQKKTTFKYSMICDQGSKKDVKREGPFVLLYCYNSTEDDGVEDDNILLYVDNTNVNDNGNHFPVQQTNLLDLWRTPHRMATIHMLDQKNAVLIITGPEKLFDVYGLSTEAKVKLPVSGGYFKRRQQYELFGQNILTSGSSHLISQPRSTETMPYYILTAYLLLPLLVGACIGIATRKKMPHKEVVKIKDVRELFEEMYNRLMNGENVDYFDHQGEVNEELLHPYHNHLVHGVERPTPHFN